MCVTHYTCLKHVAGDDLGLRQLDGEAQSGEGTELFFSLFFGVQSNTTAASADSGQIRRTLRRDQWSEVGEKVL